MHKKSIPFRSAFARDPGAVPFPSAENVPRCEDHEVKGWKRAQDPRVLVCIIVALVFAIWVALQQIYY